MYARTQKVINFEISLKTRIYGVLKLTTCKVTMVTVSWSIATRMITARKFVGRFLRVFLRG